MHTDKRLRLLTLARDLQRRKARQRSGLFVAEGIRTVEELIGTALTVRGALVSPALDATDRGRALRAALASADVPLLDVSEADFASAADTESPQGVLAIAEQPTVAVGDVIGRTAAGARLLVLDGVQDPGNAGTMLRTAAAFGAAGVVALAGTVDLWSAKVVRSAMGAHFRVPIAHATWDETSAALAAQGVALWVADMAGDDVSAVASEAPSRLAVAIGNEGAGISGELRTAAARLVSIPIATAVESLNAAIAAGILFYALRDARRGE
jgi:TrmH family RNA methyltransferase